MHVLLNAVHTLKPFWPNTLGFLPRCMKCRRGLAMRILSVRHTRDP